MLSRLRPSLLASSILLLTAVRVSAQDPDPGSLRVTKETGTAVRLSWTSSSPTTYCVRRDLFAPPVTIVAEAPGLFHVDDPPVPASLPYAWFYDVEEAPVGGCSGGGQCAPVGALTCGGTTAGRTDAPSATDALDAYPCRPGDLSGQERTLTFTATVDEDVEIVLSGTTTDLDVLVLRDDGTGCDPAACVAAGDDRALFAASAGESFLVIVDGAPGSEGAFNLDVTCTPINVPCTPVTTLACGVPFAGDTSAGCPATTQDWTGCGVTGLTGPECVHAFTAPTAGSWTATISGASVDLDVVVVRGTTCDPAACTAAGDTSATFAAAAGETFHVIVDGRAGASGSYTLTVDCPAAPTCSPAGSLTCGGTLAGRTDAPSATDALDAYPCRPGDLSGQERTLTFTATVDEDVEIVLSGTTTDLDVLVLRDGGTGCDPAACVAAGDDRVRFAAAAGDSFLVVVDGAPGSEGTLTLDVSCVPPATTCAPAGNLDCGESVVGDTAGGASSDVASGYSGCSATGLDGREQVWAFTAAEDDVVEVGLVSGGAALDLVVLRDDGSGCDPDATCLAFEDAFATLAVTAGTTYYLVVDGPSGAASAYELAVACGSQQCTSLGTVTCGALRQDNNSNSGVAMLDAYACTNEDESGPEYVYEFIAAQTGDMTITLSGTTADLDILVMEDVLGCQADSCIAFGDTAVTFPIVAGTRYFVAIDGRDGAISRYTVTFTCAVPPQDCLPAGNVDCAQAAFSNNGAVGSTDANDAYPCVGWDESGSEIAFQWIAPDDVTAIVSLSLLTEDLDVFVLEERGQGCEAAACIAAGDDSVAFDAAAGRLYFFVVDGRAGARSDFRLHVDCFPAPGTCLPTSPLACGQVVSGSNGQAGSTDTIDGWPGCTPFSEEGPEVAYEYVAGAAGTVDVALSGLTAQLDVFVLRDTGSGCTSADCFTAGDATASFAATAGERYFVVVDGRNGAVGDYTLTLTCR